MTLFVYRIPDPVSEYSPIPDWTRERIWKNVIINTGAVEVLRDEIEQLSTVEKVVLTPRNSSTEVLGLVRLDDFEHAKSTLAIVGPDSGKLTLDDLEGISVDAFVYIPTQVRHSMWSFVAFSVFWWDRLK